MSTGDRGQVTYSAADVYEEFFLPALFQQWAPRVADAAAIQPGARVLDVACGTGVLARAAAERVGATGAVIGLDVNAGMLAVAQRKAPTIDWRLGQAEELPFPSAAFDAVVSQFGLMFFVDQPRALQEMWRVLRPGGRLAVAVWDALERTPGYAAMTALLQQLFGPAVADALRAPFSLGDPQRLHALLTAAGIAGAQVTTLSGVARFPSIDAWVHTDIKGWTLADKLDNAQLAHLRYAAAHTLQPFQQVDQTVAFSAPAHIITAIKPNAHSNIAV